MIPAFTNIKRKKAYFNTPKQGFTYINWDMESELYTFQTQIEQKFRDSSINKSYRFPRTAIATPQQFTNSSLTRIYGDLDLKR